MIIVILTSCCRISIICTEPMVAGHLRSRTIWTKISPCILTTLDWSSSLLLLIPMVTIVSYSGCLPASCDENAPHIAGFLRGHSAPLEMVLTPQFSQSSLEKFSKACSKVQYFSSNLRPPLFLDTLVCSL